MPPLLKLTPKYARVLKQNSFKRYLPRCCISIIGLDSAAMLTSRHTALSLALQPPQRGRGPLMADRFSEGCNIAQYLVLFVLLDPFLPLSCSTSCGESPFLSRSGERIPCEAPLFAFLAPSIWTAPSKIANTFCLRFYSRTSWSSRALQVRDLSS